MIPAALVDAIPVAGWAIAGAGWAITAARGSRRVADAWRSEAKAQSDRMVAEQALERVNVAHGPTQELHRKTEAALSVRTAECDRLRAENAAILRNLATAMTGREAAETALSDLRFRWDQEHPAMARGPGGKFLGRADRVAKASTSTLPPEFATAGGGEGSERGMQVTPALDPAQTVVAGYADTRSVDALQYPMGRASTLIQGVFIPVHAVGDPERGETGQGVGA